MSIALLLLTGSPCAAAPLDAGTDLFEAGRVEEAADAWGAALTAAARRADADPVEVAGGWRAVGRRLIGAGLVDRGLAAHRASLALLGPDAPADRRVERIRYDAAMALRDHGFGDEALGLFEVLWAAGPTQDIRVHRVGLYLGQHHFDQGRYGEAVGPWRASLAATERVFGELHAHTAALATKLASALHGIGRFDEARPLMERSLRIIRAVRPPGHPDLALLEGNLALLCLAEGDLRCAASRQRVAVRLCEDHHGESAPPCAMHVRTLADGLERTGRPDLAGPLYERALAVQRGAGADAEVLATRLMYGELLVGLFDHEGAEPHLLEALRLAEEVRGPSHPFTARAWTAIGRLRADQERHEDALHAYERALAIDRLARPGSAAVESGIFQVASVRARLGDTDEAVAALEEIIAHSRRDLGPAHPKVAGRLAMLAAVLAGAGRFDRADAIWEEVIAIRTTHHGADGEPLVEAWMGRARIAAERGDPATAFELAARALAIDGLHLQRVLGGISEREALSATSRHRTLTSLYVASAAADEVEAAWNATLRLKGLVRAVATARREVQLSDGQPEVRALVERLAAARRALARAALEGRPDLRSLVDDKEVLERELARRTGAVHHPPLEVADLCGLMPAETALVDVLQIDAGAAPAGYVAFVLGPACTPTRVELGPAAALDAAVQHHRALLATPDAVRRADAAGARLRARVWDPLVPALGGAPRVLLSLDGGLGALSFASLPHDGGRYLIDGHTFAYLEDVRALGRSAPARSEGVAVVVGAVAYGVEGAGRALRSGPCARPLPPLPGTAAEADTVAARLRRRVDEVRLLTGDGASEAGLEEALEDATVLHVATHGFFDSGCAGPDRGALLARSGLALAGAALEPRPGDDRDGLWTAEEVSALDLSRLELVVLSACETGLGAVHAGEGALGLRRAFATAGARNLVMSLWSIEDAATRELMDDLYRHLGKRRSPSPVEALRQAQLALRSHTRPGVWGAFIASGLP